MSIPAIEGVHEEFDRQFQGLPETMRPTLAVPPSQRIPTEGGGLIVPDQLSATESATGIDLERVVRGVTDTDARILWTLALLAQGNPGRVARGVELVRYDYRRAEAFRAKALKDDIAHKVLSAALDIRTSDMEQTGLTLTDAAQRDLVGGSFYSHRYGAMLRAAPANKRSAERNFRYAIITIAAIRAAGEEVPPYIEIVPLDQRRQNI